VTAALEQRASRLPSHAGRAFASATLLSGFLALLWALDRRDLDPSAIRMAHAPIALVYGVVAIAGFVCAVAPARWRRQILLAAAVVAAPLALGAWSLAWFGYAVCVIAVARAPLAVFARLAIALIAWSVVPITRDVWLDGAAQAETIVLAIVWAGQLYSALYLIVERERESPAARSTALADAFYLLALPRLVVPYFQPISPRRLARCERPDLPAVTVWRAAGLAGYAAGLAVLAWTLAEVAPQVEPRPLALAVRFCRFYAHATYTIFTAVAMYRLLGFDLPSGFRMPFLSRSFAEFFRRFNHYVRDAVVSLFYYPLLGRLRLSLPPRAATIVSAYVAIVVGSFLFHDVLVPVSIAIEPGSTIGYYLDPIRVLGMVALWTLIIVPNAGIAPRRPTPRSRARTMLEIAAFNAVYFVLWYAQEVGRGR
jgi:hypothetical protein